MDLLITVGAVVGFGLAVLALAVGCGLVVAGRVDDAMERGAKR